MYIVRYWITSRSNDLSQGINLVVGSHCWCEFMAMNHFQLYIYQRNDLLGVIRCCGRNVTNHSRITLAKRQQAVRRILILITEGLVVPVGDQATVK